MCPRASITSTSPCSIAIIDAHSADVFSVCSSPRPSIISSRLGKNCRVTAVPTAFIPDVRAFGPSIACLNSPWLRKNVEMLATLISQKGSTSAREGRIIF